ncbi:hypothetical protein AMATHDRAFT_51832 [Amanita thiersii Skay4041]|uniref:Uncharacterized protein n=1 Tax=Amanita thiersii Skay4041 TaxID=703135 RepID=A0A2A9N7W7_9AGAR|nr:hypothetical protein AMATHDRAFT_51832 [Amanita thiersii Skay4041]
MPKRSKNPPPIRSAPGENKKLNLQPWRDTIDIIGGLIPFPFVQPASKAVVKAMDQTQAVGDNRDRFHEIQKRTTNMIQLVRKAAIAEHAETPSPEIKEALATAEKSLLTISEHLNEWMRWKSLPKEFLDSNEYQDFFTKSQSEMEQVRFNLTVNSTLPSSTPELTRDAAA